MKIMKKLLIIASFFLFIQCAHECDCVTQAELDKEIESINKNFLMFHELAVSTDSLNQIHVARTLELSRILMSTVELAHKHK